MTCNVTAENSHCALGSRVHTGSPRRGARSYPTGHPQLWRKAASRQCGCTLTCKKEGCSQQHRKWFRSVNTWPCSLVWQGTREPVHFCCSLKTEAVSPGWSEGNRQEQSPQPPPGKAGNWGRKDLHYQDRIMS